MTQPTEELLEKRAEILELALSKGAVLTGTPDGKEAITVVFSIEAWRVFSDSIKL